MGAPATENLASAINTTGTSTGRVSSNKIATSAKPATGTPKKLKGFASMDPERVRQIASMGGVAAHKSGHAHQFNSAEAREASAKRHSKRVPYGSDL